MQSFEKLNFILRLDNSSTWKRWSGPWEDSGRAVLAAVRKMYPGKTFALLPGSMVSVQDPEWETRL